MKNLTLAVTLALNLVDRAAAIGALVRKAQAEGRDVTDAELDELEAADDAARGELADAIEQARKQP